MTTDITIDNSLDGDLKRAITWQYDKAQHLVGVIGMLRDFAGESTEDFWDEINARLNIGSEQEGSSDPSYQLAVWGKLLGIKRPTLNFGTDDEPDRRVMSADLFRRIIVGRLKLLHHAPTVDDYIAFLKFVFKNNVSAVPRTDMSIGFLFRSKANPTAEEDEMRRAVEQVPDIVFAYPAGVKSNVRDRGPVLGFYGQQTSYPKVDKGDFAITNFSGSPVFAWPRKAK